jgi:hypothetical protein
MSIVLVSQNGLGLKNTINTNIERYRLLYRHMKYSVLILAKRKRPKSLDPL